MRAADMPGAGDSMKRAYAATAQKEREPIRERIRAALAAAKARGVALGRDRGTGRQRRPVQLLRPSGGARRQTGLHIGCCWR